MSKIRACARNHQVVHIFMPYLFAKCGIVILKGVDNDRSLERSGQGGGFPTGSERVRPVSQD
jgi:hypothetical protein